MTLIFCHKIKNFKGKGNSLWMDFGQEGRED